MSVTDRTLSGSQQVPGQRSGSPVGADDTGSPTKSRKKRLIVGVVLLVALLGAGGGGFVMLTGTEAESETTEAAETKPEPEPGAVVPLDAVTINLADGRYLQVGVALQQAYHEGEKEAEELDGSPALDILIRTLSGRAMTELTTAEQREAIKAQLVTEIAEAYHDEVYDIYFTSFVMQ